MSKNTQPAMAYPTTEQYKQWKDRAEQMDMSVSEFMKAMTEAGWKKFDANVEPDQTNRELREQRNDLKQELERARQRISKLEDQLHHSERAVIRRYVRENPGANYDEIQQYVLKTVPQRVTEHLDELEGEVLRRGPDGGYYHEEGER